MKQKIMFSKLRKIRENNKMTLKELASKLGISMSYLSKIETRGIHIDYAMAVKIAMVFGLKPDDIFLEDMLYHKCDELNKKRLANNG